MRKLIIVLLILGFWAPTVLGNGDADHHGEIGAHGNVVAVHHSNGTGSLLNLFNKVLPRIGVGTDTLLKRQFTLGATFHVRSDGGVLEGFSVRYTRGKQGQKLNLTRTFLITLVGFDVGPAPIRLNEQQTRPARNVWGGEAMLQLMLSTYSVFVGVDEDGRLVSSLGIGLAF